MIDSMNPKIMAENIQALVAGAGSGGSSVTLDYGTDPVNTGYKFLNKEVYRAVIPFSDSAETITVSGSNEFNAPEGIETPINASYVFDGSAGNYGMIIQANQVRIVSGKCRVYVDNASFSGVPGNTFYLLLDYTKIES